MQSGLEMKKEAKTTDILLLILLAAIWGSAFFNIKIATYTYDTITLVFVRVFFALIALAFYCSYKNIKIMAFSKDWKMYALVGLCNIVIPFFTYSLRHKQSSKLFSSNINEHYSFKWNNIGTFFYKK